MNPAAFLQAEQLEPLPYVLGVRLRSFSLGHRWLLSAIGNSFLVGGETTIDDLVSAVLICGQSFEDAQRTIIESIENPAAHNRMVLKWCDSMTGAGRWTVRLGLQKAKPIDFKTHSEAFAEYLKTSEAHPGYKYEPGDPIDAPLEQIIKVTLWRSLPITESELMNRSWKKCVLDFLTIKAIDGGIDFADEEEVEELVKMGREFFQKNPNIVRQN